MCIYTYIYIYIYMYVSYCLLPMLSRSLPVPADGPSPWLVAPDVGQAHATGLGPWVLHGLGLSPIPPPAPAPSPWAPPAPPRVNLLTRSLRELTRRIVLSSQRKEGNSHRRTAEGPGGGGAGAKGPGGPVSVEGNCRRVEYIIGQHIG